MPLFSYVALDQAGREQNGEVEAVNAREAAAALRNQSVYVVSISEGGGAAMQGLRARMPSLSPKQYLPVRSNDLVFMFRQLALMLRSGHTVVQALEASREMVFKHGLRRALGQMIEHIESGGSLSRSIARQGDLFPPVVAKLLEAGEQSGEVDTILERLADDMERRQDLKRQMGTALTYPMIVFVMAIGVSTALVGWVIPRFARFLTSRDAELPPVTQFLLDISDWFQDWGPTLGVVTLVWVLGILVSATTRPGKKAIDRVLLAMPVVGKVVSASALAQATWTLAMQLRSGITLLNGLRITRDVLGNQVMAAAFGDASERILAGQSLSTALRRREIPHLVSHMAAIGERSGQLEGVMQALGEYYQKDLQGRVKMLAAWVEPAMIVFVGGLVAVVYLAFFQAALKVSSGGG